MLQQLEWGSPALGHVAPSGAAAFGARAIFKRGLGTFDVPPDRKCVVAEDDESKHKLFDVSLHRSRPEVSHATYNI